AQHDWPGNVRELTHFAERVALGLAFPVAEAAAPAAGASLAERVDAYEAALLRQALAEHGGAVQPVLEALRLPRKTFYDKLRRHGIEAQDYRAEKKGAGP
ncbi:transcriptional regulator, Fis family, partial [Pseudoroseomonas cervicalis ATCC 49957]